MDKQKKALASAVATAIIAASSLPAKAAEEDIWKIEITPYVWAAGVDGDVVVGSHEASVDASFNDILDHLQIAASFLATAQYHSWVSWAQVDYMDLDTDIDRGPVSGSLDTKVVMATLGFGYQFKGWSEKQTFDVLLGVRNLSLDNELHLDTLGNFESDKSFTHPVVILRPSIQLSERWRFNPTLSYGKGGNVDTNWELQPQLQFQAWENVAFRFGYRKLHYEIESDSGNARFDGSFQGPIIGVGMTLGSTPKKAVAAPLPPPPPAPMPVAVAPKDTDGDGVPDSKDQCPNTPAGQRVDTLGCGRDISVEAMFDTDSATIKPESYAALDRAVDLLKRVPTMQGVIEGYTDSTGSDAHNLKLSQRRAAAVSDYLVKHGIDAARAPSKGFGEAQPVADNATPEGRALNRRVVLQRTDAGT